jgi:hypothetical protein
MPGNPMLWLCIILGLALPGVYGTMKVLEAKRVAAALTEGKRVGAAQVAAATAQKAQETVAKADEGEASAPVVPAEMAALKALCDRSASCRDRGMK